MKSRRSLQEVDARQRVVREMVADGVEVAVELGAGALALVLAVVCLAAWFVGVWAVGVGIMWVEALLGGVIATAAGAGAGIGVVALGVYRGRLRKAGILPTRCPVCCTKPCRHRCEEIYGAEFIEDHRRLQA